MAAEGKEQTRTDSMCVVELVVTDVSKECHGFSCKGVGLQQGHCEVRQTRIYSAIEQRAVRSWQFVVVLRERTAVAGVAWLVVQQAVNQSDS
jgi:hypothetical protein